MIHASLAIIVHNFTDLYHFTSELRIIINMSYCLELVRAQRSFCAAQEYQTPRCLPVQCGKQQCELEMGFLLRQLKRKTYLRGSRLETSSLSNFEVYHCTFVLEFHRHRWSGTNQVNATYSVVALQKLIVNRDN